MRSVPRPKLRQMPRIALLFLLLLPLISCSKESQQEESTVTIEFWTIALGDAFADYILGMISTYEQAHPGVKIKWVDVSGGEVAEKFLAALVGDTAPDLVDALNAVLIGAGRQPVTLEHGRWWVAGGSVRLIQKGFNLSLNQALASPLRQQLLDYYQALNLPK